MITFDPDRLAARAAELEEQMGAPGFWDDSERAAVVTAEHARASRRLEAFTALQADVEDLDGLVEMAVEEESLQAEVEEQIASVEERLGALEEQRLFSGPYDSGDALVSVNAGAGGTDAQDWAEMVLRMEMRWAERRGFGVELLEASAGEEAGIQSVASRETRNGSAGSHSRSSLPGSVRDRCVHRRDRARASLAKTFRRVNRNARPNARKRPALSRRPSRLPL